MLVLNCKSYEITRQNCSLHNPENDTLLLLPMSLVCIIAGVLMGPLHVKIGRQDRLYFASFSKEGLASHTRT